MSTPTKEKARQYVMHHTRPKSKDAETRAIEMLTKLLEDHAIECSANADS
jgi:hypothetical protein